MMSASSPSADFQPVRGKPRKKDPMPPSSEAPSAKSPSPRDPRPRGPRPPPRAPKSNPSSAAPSRRIDRGKSAELWNCSQCTFENGPKNAFCGMCETPRPESAHNPKPPVLNSLGPGESSEQPGDYHLQIMWLPGSTIPQEVIEYLSQRAPNFPVRRLCMRYNKELPTRDKGRLQLGAECAGPSGEHDVVGNALVEFYAAPNLQDQLRELVAAKPHNVISRVPGWSKSFHVPFFPSDAFPNQPAVGAGGLKICELAKRPCWRDNCRHAHEPELWGVATPPSASLRPGLVKPHTDDEVLERVKDISLKEYTQPPRTRPCNACSAQQVSNLPLDQLLLCPACQARGAPKVACPRCHQMVFTSDYDAASGSCALCVDQLAAVLAPPQRPHFRLVVRKDVPHGQLPSPRELRREIEDLFHVGVAHIEYSGDGVNVPLAASIRMVGWSETVSALLLAHKLAIPNCEMCPMGAPEPAEARRRALANLVTRGDLREDEFAVLDEWLARRGW